nr:multidrug transporter MATE [Vibrio cholerae]
MAGPVAKMIQLMTSSSFESVIRFFGIFLLVKAMPLGVFGEYSIIVAFAAITATIVNFGGYNLIMSSKKSVYITYFYEIAV